MVGVLSNKIGRDELKPGDHIYSWRLSYLYAHHGIYVGNGNVIHFTRGAGQEIGTGTVLDRYIYSSCPSNPSDSPCPRCGDQSKTDGVISSCLECFLSDGELYLFQYGVSPAFFLAKVRGGTCTFTNSDPPEDAVYRANYLLQNGFGVYNLFKNNCEDFAIYCKTGLLIFTNVSLGRSGQASTFLAAATAIVSLPLRFMTMGFPGLSAVGCGIYSICRVVNDIGIRRDVMKIPVERLVSGNICDVPITETQTLKERLVSGSSCNEAVAETQTMVGVLSNKIGRDEMKPGDHIYSWRLSYLYAHHGIYVGNGNVIHFTRGAGQEIGTGTVLDRYIYSSCPSNSSDSPCPRCGDQSKTDGVISSCLECFLSDGELYLFQYGVSPAFFLAKVRGGTCTLANSDPPEDAVYRANYLLQNGFGGYNFFKNNFEDFAIYCKTGLIITTKFSLGRSGQALTFEAAASAVSSTLRFMTTSFTGLMVGCGIYSICRVVTDIGIRHDAMKIPVERLVSGSICDVPITETQNLKETLVSGSSCDEPIAEAQTREERLVSGSSCNEAVAETQNMLGVLSNKIGRDELKPGDHIYSWRLSYLYAHHGIYVGNGNVIHFTRGAGQEIGTGTVLDRYIYSSCPSNPSDSPCPRCGDQSKTDGVISSCLECFLSDGELYLFQYGVSPAFFLAKVRGGTCTLANSDPPEDAVYRANYLLQNGFGGYNLFKNNCEDFAIYCKTGLIITAKFSLGRSGQALTFEAAASAVSSALRFMTTSFTGLMVGCGIYSVCRVVTDIGIRHDVMKIPVERLVGGNICNVPITETQTLKERLVSGSSCDEPIPENKLAKRGWLVAPAAMRLYLKEKLHRCK